VYNTQINSKELLKLLERDGWIVRNSKGSHHVFKHPVKTGHITVPHPKKDLGVGLVQKLLKQAGIK
jgi:predicted RNA binding protein YcfA (HicA-like mRNA interferase family)